VEVADVAFEGNFVNIHTKDATGKSLIVESRNDTSTPPPASGIKMHFVFDSAKAFILADQKGAAPVGDAA
jgi:spermidine/putrescine transport system ATP-binding protein